MRIIVCDSRADLGIRAAAEGARAIRAAQKSCPAIAIIVATGTSQFEVLSELAMAPDIDWKEISIFHLDEYVGLPVSHPASFRKYLQDRFISKLPDHPAAFYAIDAEDDPKTEIARLNALISAVQITVAFIGIGENGHLAFNDPPADFETEEPYLVVQLDEACRRQQLGEGWFPTFDSVPESAVSMSIRQILKSSHIICSVPDARKAEPVKKTVEGAITPHVPASILQTHANCSLYLDSESASLLAGG